MIRHTLVNPTLAGLYNLAPAGHTTWHGYACHGSEGARQRGLALRVGADRVLPVSTDEYPTAAVRPRNSRLNVDKLQRNFGLRLPHWTQGVDRMLDELTPAQS
jgi:dTDP-4-dehydrorhamnose reductase